MNEVSGVLPVSPGAEHAWPELLCAADPWAGDEMLGEGEPDDGFFPMYRGVLEGRLPWEAAAAAAIRLGLDGPLKHDRRPPRAAPVPIDDALLAELAADVVPDLGMLAPDRVLGPWADERLPPRLLALASAVMALSPLIPPSVRPVARALRAKRPRRSVEERAALRAVMTAPPMVWTAQGPQLPLDERYAIGVALPAPAVVARVVPGMGLAMALPLPRVPDAAVLFRRMLLEYHRLRRYEPRLTWEDVLRERGEVLYRTACEWCWVHAREEVLPCWSSWA